MTSRFSWLKFMFVTLMFASLSGEFAPIGAQDLGYSERIRQIRGAEQVMRDYRKSHGHFPRLQPELDECLHLMYDGVSMTPSDTTIVPQGDGIYRIFYQFAIAVNPSIRSLVNINGQWQVPADWQSMPGTITVYSDGQDLCVLWVSGSSHKPEVDASTMKPMLIRIDATPPPSAGTTDDSSN